MRNLGAASHQTGEAATGVLSVAEDVTEHVSALDKDIQGFVGSMKSATVAPGMAA